ncbi:MAG TPA: SDR family NAD(P)-dependent oxidoreductase [Actinomycetales bacterium]|nr:SDR family NAD(P)-dependent oxidoreductase [Actinomycetales bacterium]
MTGPDAPGRTPGAPRVALVTGGSRGVGKGVATALAAAGWTVYVTGRSVERLQGTVDAAADGPGEVRALECDHGSDEQIAAVFTRIAADAGRLDLLVNNVWTNPKGFMGFNGRFWERPTADWDALMGIGLRAHYVACCEAAKIMVPQGSGLMVNISSFGSRAPFHTVLYGMSKTALDKMASDMAHELAGTGVATLSLWLGLIRTELILSLGMDDFNGFPLDRAEDPTFVGRVIDALTHDPGLAAMSGTTVITAEYGREHGIVNDDGEVPLSHRGSFGGGPLFPPVTDAQLGIETIDEVAEAGGHNGFAGG